MALLVCFRNRHQDYNHGHNILKLFDVLPILPFTTSEAKPDY